MLPGGSAVDWLAAGTYTEASVVAVTLRDAKSSRPESKR